MKKRLFIANDAHYLSSGYGVYGKELLTRLHNSGKYEIAELACYCTEDNEQIHNCPWKVYPNNPLKTDEKQIELYGTSAQNQFGNWRFNRSILDFKPHIVFDVRDYWMSSYQETSPYRRHFHWILMPTVDSAPQKTEWYYTFANADIIVPYTQWAKNTLIKGGANKLNLFPKNVNAGINPNEFYPIENKKEHQKKYFGRDVNVVGLVMRNQKRKLMPDIMRSFRAYIDQLKSENDPRAENTILYFHTSYPEELGWDIPSLLVEFQLVDKVYFTYRCKNCNEWMPSKFNNAIMDCKLCGKQNGAFFSSVSSGLENKQLNEVYNLFDVYLQYAIGEGFGMCQVEAASAGIPIASVDYSAMSEIVRNVGGTPIPIERAFRELETGADRVYPDNNFTTKFLYDFFNIPDNERLELGRKTREKCIAIYTWDQVYKVWDEVFETIDITKKVAWGDKEFFATNHEAMKVPANLNPRDFVEYIVYNVINEPPLFNTAAVQMLIKEMCGKIVARGGAIKSFYYPEATQVLENMLNNKIMHEQARHNEDKLKKGELSDMSDAQKTIEEIEEDPNVIKRIHTPCKKCSFAQYSENTQVGCHLDYINRYKNNSITILEAYDNEREFFIVNGKKCIGYREDTYFPSESTLEEKIELFHKKNHLQYLMVVNLKNMTKEDLVNVGDQIKSLTISPQKLIFVRYQDKDQRHHYFNIESVIKNSGYDGLWEVKTMMVDMPYLNALHEVMNMNKKHRFVLSIDNPTNFTNLVTSAQKTVYEDLGSFIAYSDKDGSSLLFSAPNYRYSLLIDKKDLLTDKTMHIIIE